MAQRNDPIHRRVRSNPSRHNNYYDERPMSLELETDFTNTETKLVVLDFLSSQPIEHLTARNATRRKTVSFDDRHRKSSLGKSSSLGSSDGSSHEAYRSRYAKLAKSGKSLRKQYSLRLKRDLDEYLKLRGKSMDDLSDPPGTPAGSWDEGMGEYQHQRSYTEGETYFRLRSRSPIRAQSQSADSPKPRRKISRELKEGITDFNIESLRHVEVEEVSVLTESMDDNIVRSRRHRPESLELPCHQERRLSPVLSPESQVAVRLEMISQEILTKYPDIFDEQISRVSLQDLTYEKFASVARKVIEKHPGGWTRIALVCYFARELALEDESTDDQLDNLVSFSSKFISETSAEWIASQGGW
ncbi:bcl-2 homologous antagonist killer-like, partial [Paramuricea clavata]